MNFVAIDVETANPDMSSICQIWLAGYDNGSLILEWESYLNPEDYFDAINISIHGIDESAVSESPTFPELAETLFSLLGDNVVVCHTHFDRVALHQAATRYCVLMPTYIWLDSARVVRRTWEEFAWRGYGLQNVCKYLGYEFNPHDALEDAKAAGHILLTAIKKSGINIEEWLGRVEQPIDTAANSYSSKIKREGNPEGALFGEIVVFTGTLEIPRRQAAEMASNIGCQVVSGVTKKTTLLVVGDQDVKKLAGHQKSSKHRKAEELIQKGSPIRIIKESDFKQLVQY